MDCGRIKEELLAYLDGELGENQAARVRKHLDLCPACKLQSSQLEAAGTVLDAIPEIEPAQDFTARTLKRAMNTQVEPAVSRLRLIRRLAPVAAAAAVLIALTLWLVVPSGPISIEDLSPVEKEIVQNMEVLENLEILENLEVLSDLELLLEYDEEDFESS
jgi:anti-sigma factor RsiW